MSINTVEIESDDGPLVVVQTTSAPTSQPTLSPQAPTAPKDSVRQEIDELTEIMHDDVMTTDHMLARQRADDFHGTGPLARMDAILEQTEAMRVRAEARAAAALAKLSADPSIPSSTVVIAEVTEEQAAAIQAEEAAKNAPPVIPLEYHPLPASVEMP